MPDPLDPTAQVILDAAESLFARQGFAATTVKQLGARAGVTPALLYYYFRDKDGLYEAVLERILGQLAGAAGERLGTAPSPQQAVRSIVALQAEILTARPDAARLILRELVDHEARHAGPVASAFVTTAFRGLCDAIRAGQAAGHFRRDLRPEHAALSTIAQVVYAFLARPLFLSQRGDGSGLAGPDALREFGAHAADFAVAALAATREPAR